MDYPESSNADVNTKAGMQINILQIPLNLVNLNPELNADVIDVPEPTSGYVLVQSVVSRKEPRPHPLKEKQFFFARQVHQGLDLFIAHAHRLLTQYVFAVF